MHIASIFIGIDILFLYAARNDEPRIGGFITIVIHI